MTDAPLNRVDGDLGVSPLKGAMLRLSYGRSLIARVCHPRMNPSIGELQILGPAQLIGLEMSARLGASKDIQDTLA